MMLKSALISRGFIDVFMITYQLGICCVYIVFVATNIKQVNHKKNAIRNLDLTFCDIRYRENTCRN